MDTKKAYGRIDWKTMQEVLEVYGIGGSVLDEVRAFYRNANVC